MTARRSSSPPRGAGSGAPVTGDLRRREQLRQQLLASAVLARFDAPLSPVLAGWLQQDGATARRGVAAYRANAQASAHAALAAAYPTLQQMLGDESFETLARVYRLRHPAIRGDLAWYGEAVPALVEATRPPRPAASANPRKTTSAIGDRQMLPVQTNTTRNGSPLLAAMRSILAPAVETTKSRMPRHAARAVTDR